MRSSIEAEQAVISGCLMDGSAFEQIADVLAPAHFRDSGLRAAYAAMQELYQRNRPIELFTVLEIVGDSQLEYLGRIAKAAYSPRNVLRYARLVLERDVEHRLRAAGEAIVALSETATEPLEERLDQAEAALMAVRQSLRTRADGPRPLRSALLEVVDLVDERYTRKPGSAGLPTGFTDLDKLLTGLRPGMLVLIGGRPGTGKSTLALNIVERVALQHGGSALVFSLEMSAAELAMRAIASVGRVDFQRLRTGHEMTDDDWPRLTAGVSKLADAPILVDDAAGLSLIELRARARRVARERDLKLVVVDYLQLMAVDRRAESRHLALGEISTGLKALAKELRLPVLALSQLSREVERRQGRKPTLADLRDSGSLEADADVVLLLHQGRTDDDTPTGVADVVVAKQRNGPTGSVKLAFRGELCRFEDCAQTEEPIPLSRPRRPYRGGFDG